MIQRLPLASGYEVSPKVFQPSNCAVKLDFPSKFYVVIADIALESRPTSQLDFPRLRYRSRARCDLSAVERRVYSASVRYCRAGSSPSALGSRDTANSDVAAYFACCNLCLASFLKACSCSEARERRMFLTL